MASTMQPDKPFRFLDLPAELRSLVYEEVFARYEMLLLRHYPAPAPAILLTSKHIYSEAVKTFYRKTTFYAALLSDMSMLVAAAKDHHEAITRVKRLNDPYDPDHISRAFDRIRGQLSYYSLILREGVIQVIQSGPGDELFWINDLDEVVGLSTREKELCRSS